MITREILKAQLDLYTKGKQQAIETFEKAKAELNAFNGAIEACQSLLNLNDELETAQNKESSEDQKPA